ncbi:phage tail tape measure protein [Spartinivicinus ruber]|uniref:phage tail tape measure protein n=1 Tax=Spartinivicinus ruber TaxID=2683272 RepID=UPI0013D8D821|nr:phage tail tape measure protein [Spartinivicinus ruber]
MSQSSYSIAIEAVDRFSGPVRSFNRVNHALTQGLTDQRQALGRLQLLQRDIGSLQRQQTALQGVRRRLQDAREQQDLLRAAMDRAAQPTAQLTRQFDRAQRAVRDLEAAERQQHHRLRTLTSQLSTAGVETNDLTRAQARLQSVTEQANRALAQQRESLQRLSEAERRVEQNRARGAELRGQLLTAGLAAAPLAVPIKQAVSFESSMADVFKVVDFKGSEAEQNQQREKMQQDILKMSTNMPIAASGIAEIVAAAGQSGVAKDELLGFAESAAKMSVAFDISADEAGKTMAAWRAGMNLSQQEAVALANTTNFLSNNMNATAADISEVLRRSGGIAKGSGFNETQAASFTAALLSAGDAPDVAATAFKNIAGAMTKGNAATGGQKEAWQQLGFNPEQVALEMQQNAPEMLLKVFERFKEVPKEQQSALISKLFGEEAKGPVSALIGNMDNLKKSFLLTNQSAKSLGSSAERLRILGDAANKLDERGDSMQLEYESRKATTENNFIELGNSFNRLQIILGQELLPVVNRIIEPLKSGLNWLSDWLSASKEAGSAMPTIIAFGAAIAAIAPALLVGGRLIRHFFRSISDQNRLSRARLDANTRNTALAATRAATAVQGLNTQLNSLAGGRGGGRNGTRRTTGAESSRLGRRGGRLGGLLAGGAMLLGTAGASEMTTEAVMNQGQPEASETSATELTTSVGEVLGGMGGAWAGAAAGAAIGSVIPVVGTAIGGAIGGILGSMAGTELGGDVGEWVGGLIDGDEEEAIEGEEEKGWFSRLFSDDEKLEDPPKLEQIANNQQTQQTIHFAPTLQLPQSSGSPQADKNYLDMIWQELKAKFEAEMPAMASELNTHHSLRDRADI